MRGVGSDFAAFETLGRDECIEGWRRQFEHQPPKYVSVQFMRRVLAFEAQVKAHGGISPALRRALERTLKGDRNPNRKIKGDSVPSSSRTTPPVLRLGTHLVREWNGRPYQVEVMEDGLRMDGKQYRSLSAIARKITGTHWSGPRFFGLV